MRARRFPLILLLFGLLLGGALPAVPAAGASPGAAPQPTLVTAAPGSQRGPRTDGATVVWNDGRTGDLGNTDIYAADLSDRREFPVATGPLDQTFPDIDGGIVVWEQARQTCPPECGNTDIRARELATGHEFAIADTPAVERSPAISGRWVVWISMSAGTPPSQTLMARDLGAMAAPIPLAPLGDPPAGRPAIDGLRVVWGEQAIGADRRERWRLLTLQIGGAGPTVLAEGVGSLIAQSGLFGWDVRGDIAVYAAERQLTAIDLRTGERRTIADQAQQPTTDGRYVFWEDHRFFSQTEGRRVDLRGYDLATDSTFSVAVDSGYHARPHTKGGILTWSRGQGDDADIHAVPVRDVLPSACRPAEESTADRAYFPETSHTLGGGFRAFWEQSGGLPVFGYTLTEEFAERSADDGRVYTVQYLERQRFEHHPEYAGTAYETLIGRLGVADAARRGLLGSAPFQPVAEGDDPDCAYFPETGHRACGAFLRYWQGHGLELGDPEVSYREALALFGYPIGEAFTDPELGLTVQYFERARFEWHPENEAPYDVLLGRLAAELVAARGW